MFLKYFAFLCRSIATHIGKKLGIREIVPRKPPSNPYLEDAFKKSRNPSYDVIQVCIFLLEIYIFSDYVTAVFTVDVKSLNCLSCI